MYFHGTSTWGPHQYDKGRYSGKVTAETPHLRAYSIRYRTRETTNHEMNHATRIMVSLVWSKYSSSLDKHR
jgi:hypothetical protein